MQGNFLWGGSSLFKRTKAPPTQCFLGDIKASGYAAKQCQNQSWRPDPLAPLSFPKSYIIFRKGSELFWMLRYQRDPCSVSSQHLVLGSCHPFPTRHVCPELRPPQTHTRPYPSAWSLLPFIRRALHRAFRRFS